MNALQFTRGIPIQNLINQRRINDIRFGHSKEEVFWSEVVNAKGMIFRKNRSSDQVLVSGELDVQGSIGYGGGEFELNEVQLVMVSRSGNVVIQELAPQGGQHCLNLQWNQLASPAISPDGSRILFIASSDENDCIALAEVSGLTAAFSIIQGSDFYMSPVWHPDGKRIAWMEWSHPSMPWEAGCIKTGVVSKKNHLLENEKWIAGSIGNAASQPQFSHCGRWLSYIIRDGKWDNLVIHDLESGIPRILVRGYGFHLRLPDWVQGMHSYGWGHASSHIYYLQYSHGQSQLWRVTITSGISEEMDISPFTWATQLSVSLKTGQVAFIGSSPGHPRQIAVLSPEPEFHFMESPKSIGTPNTPVFKEIRYLCSQGFPVYGWLFEPANPLPDMPLIMHVHGGPTSVEPLSFSTETLFFTSRGYRVAEVNYRGSSTYGYEYQDALRHAWGIVDVEDVIGLLDELIRGHQVNPEKIALMGSSAGGFTVLNCLIRHSDRFKAAVCSYGICDLVADARNTHKFERFYHRFLTGDLEQDFNRFIDRSPINHIDQIKTPLLLFHGGRDPVVNVAQSRMMFQKLHENNIPCKLVVYPDEGHGFRKNNNVVDFYQTVETFLNNRLGQK